MTLQCRSCKVAVHLFQQYVLIYGCTSLRYSWYEQGDVPNSNAMHDDDNALTIASMIAQCSSCKVAGHLSQQNVLISTMNKHHFLTV